MSGDSVYVHTASHAVGYRWYQVAVSGRTRPKMVQRPFGADIFEGLLRPQGSTLVVLASRFSA